MSHDLLISLYWHLILDMLSLGTWYLTLDILHPIHDMLSLDTWYLALDIWHLILDMLSLVTWDLISDTWRFICYHLVLTYLTICCDIWLDIITLDTCITLPIHDYHFYGDLTWLLYFYQISSTFVLLYCCTPELLYLLYSCPSIVTLVNSMVIPASDGACLLVSGWRGCIPWSC